MAQQQPETVDAEFYVVVEPEWSHWYKDEDGRPILARAKAVKLTQSRPQTIKGDAFVTRLTLRIDSAALLPLQPQAVIHIAPGDVEVIEVEAQAPEGD